MVSIIVTDLTIRELVGKSYEKGGRSILDPKKLREEWMSGYGTRLRPKLEKRRYRAADPHWWEHAQFDQFRTVWRGEVKAP